LRALFILLSMMLEVSSALALDDRFCSYLVAHYETTPDLVNQYQIDGIRTAISVASPELKARMIRAARAGLRRNERAYNDETRGLQSIYRLWLLGEPLENIEGAVRPLIDAYLEDRIAPGEAANPAVPEWFLNEARPEVLAARQVATRKIDDWTSSYRPFFVIKNEETELIPDESLEEFGRRIGRKVKIINGDPDKIDEQFAPGLQKLFGSRASSRIRFDKEGEYEIWGYRLVEAAQIALTVGGRTEAARLLRYAVMLRDWSAAEEIANLLRNDVALFNIAMVQLAEASALMALGMEHNSLDFSTINPLFGAAIGALGRIRDPRLRTDVKEILVALARRLTDEDFISERREGSKDWAIRDEIDYYVMALNALRLTGEFVDLQDTRGDMGKVITLVTDVHVATFITEYCDHVAKHEEELLKNSDGVSEALSAVGDSDRLRRYGELLFGLRRTGKHHIPENYYFSSFQYFVAAGKIDGNYQPAVSVLYALIEVGIPGDGPIRLSGTDTRIFSDIVTTGSRELMEYYVHKLEQNNNTYLLLQFAAIKAGGALNEQEERFPFNPRVPRALRSVVVDEVFRGKVLDNWAPDATEAESERRRAIALRDAGKPRTAYHHALRAQDPALLIGVGDALVELSERRPDPLIAIDAFNAYAYAALLQNGPFGSP